MQNKNKLKDEYRGNFTSRENGLIVKNAVEAFEKKLSKQKHS